MSYVWRFGYGSNIGKKNLCKNNLNPTRVIAGTIAGWDIYFSVGLSKYQEPAMAYIRTHADGDAGKLHGTAFLIPEEEAAKLDVQEGLYNVQPVTFVAYDGEVVEGVGLYVSKTGPQGGGEELLPSLRYLRVVQNGAREAGLAEEWLRRLDSVAYYVTPPEVRKQTEVWIAAFNNHPARKDELWTGEELSKYDGSDPALGVRVSIMGYIVKVSPERFFLPPWKGHDITRRGVLQWNGRNIRANDIRFDQPGFRPQPKLASLSDEEREYLFQGLDNLLHGGGTIVARLQEFVEDQNA